jgi:hypothetical protein
MSATLRQLIHSPTTTPGLTIHCSPAPRVTSLTDWIHLVISSPTSGIASTAPPLGGLDHLPAAPIPKLESCMIITNPLGIWAAEKNQGVRQWQLQLQVVSTPRSVMADSCGIHRFGHLEMTCHECSKVGLLECYMWNRQPFKTARNLGMISFATWCVAKASAESPHWQITEKYMNTFMQQNNIWSITYEAWKKEILKKVYWCNSQHWLVYTQTSTRFKHMSIWIYLILFNQHGTPL